MTINFPPNIGFISSPNQSALNTKHSPKVKEIASELFKQTNAKNMLEGHIERSRTKKNLAFAAFYGADIVNKIFDPFDFSKEEQDKLNIFGSRPYQVLHGKGKPLNLYEINHSATRSQK